MVCIETGCRRGVLQQNHIGGTAVTTPVQFALSNIGVWCCQIARLGRRQVLTLHGWQWAADAKSRSVAREAQSVLSTRAWKEKQVAELPDLRMRHHHMLPRQ